MNDYNHLATDLLGETQKEDSDMNRDTEQQDIDKEPDAMIEKGQNYDDLRTRLASVLHDHMKYWMKIAIKYPNVDRDFLNKSFDELASIDQLVPLRDADTILDIVWGNKI